MPSSKNAYIFSNTSLNNLEVRDFFGVLPNTLLDKTKAIALQCHNGLGETVLDQSEDQSCINMWP